MHPLLPSARGGGVGASKNTMVIAPTRKTQTAILLRGERKVVAVPSGEWLKHGLDEQLEREQALWASPQRYFRASGAGNPCVRALTLRAIGHNVPVPARTMRIFETGRKIEESNVETARRAGLLVERSEQRQAVYGGQMRAVRALTHGLKAQEEREVRERFARHEPVLGVWFAGKGEPSARSERLVVFEEDIPEGWHGRFEFAGLRFRPDEDSEDPPILGHIDLTVRRPSDKAEMLGEIKSMRGELFRKLPREHETMLAGESPLFEKRADYIIQWNTYAFAPTIDLEEGFILFESKNDSELRVYWLRRDKELQSKMLERHREAAPYILSDPQRVAPVPNARSPEKGDKLCVDCPIRYLCRRLPVEGCDYAEVRDEDAKVRG
ncbi:hypothetical protein LCGC14_1860990 [marine sediment metagenome]|uniref:PD-(D/E)XK endonuclease-like domain-containing protein n=1 Tax=marine sediment metagenome TaxID=412755 RepID=A0A0F9IM18_9ZZZZ